MYKLLVLCFVAFSCGSLCGAMSLIDAVESGNLEEVKVAIKAIKSAGSLDTIDDKYRYGRTVLFEAIKRGNKDIVQELVKAGAYINAKDDEKYTPLMLAVNAGKIDIVQLLIEAKADINAKDGRGQTALILAVQGGQKDIVKMLIDAGADVRIKDGFGKTGRTAYDYAERHHRDDIAGMLKDAMDKK